jgi:hypothetical protein
MSYGKMIINDKLLLDIERVEIRGGDMVFYATGFSLRKKDMPTGIAAVAVYGTDGVLAFVYTMDFEDKLVQGGKGISVTVYQPIKIKDIENQPLKLDHNYCS